MDFRYVTVYQILDTSVPYVFRSFDDAQDKLNFDDYTQVAKFSANKDKSVQELLDITFEFGNNGTLQIEYDMRSVSVSDIIEIDNKYYYVDDIGFKEVFFDERKSS